MAGKNYEQNDQTEEDFGQQQSQSVKESADTVKNNAKKMGKVIPHKRRQRARFGRSIKKTAKAMGEAIKTALKAIYSLLKALVSILGSFGFFIIIVLIIVAVVAVVVVGVGYFTTNLFSGGFDEDNQTTTSTNGIKGDNFYGMRTIYFDETFAKGDLADIYLEFTHNILSDLNASENGIKLNIDFTKNYSENNSIDLITKEFAADLAGIEELNLLSSTSIIDHYGFTDNEKSTVLNSLTNTICNSQNNFLLTSVDENLFKTALQEAYEANFGYMKNVCAKILVKDYLLNEDETVSNITKENYIASIFMPKQDVSISSIGMIYIVDKEQTVTSKLTFTNSKETQILDESTIDSSWYEDYAREIQSYEPESALNVKQFSAIDTNNTSYLSTEKSLFRIIKEGNYNKYFKNTDGDFSKESLINNINSEEYLMLQFSPTSAFNFVEFETVYE